VRHCGRHVDVAFLCLGFLCYDIGPMLPCPSPVSLGMGLVEERNQFKVDNNLAHLLSTLMSMSRAVSSIFINYVV